MGFVIPLHIKHGEESVGKVNNSGNTGVNRSILKKSMTQFSNIKMNTNKNDNVYNKIPASSRSQQSLTLNPNFNTKY